MMEIQLNGTQHSIFANQSVRDLVTHLQITNQMLAVAVNREIIPRQAWSERILQANDRVDIVYAIGGG